MTAEQNERTLTVQNLQIFATMRVDSNLNYILNIQNGKLRIPFCKMAYQIWIVRKWCPKDHANAGQNL